MKRTFILFTLVVSMLSLSLIGFSSSASASSPGAYVCISGKNDYTWHLTTSGHYTVLRIKGERATSSGDGRDWTVTISTKRNLRKSLGRMYRAKVTAVSPSAYLVKEFVIKGYLQNCSPSGQVFL